MQDKSIPTRVISSTYPEQISQLIDRWQGAAHLVLCGYGGNPKAAYPGWKKASPDPAKAFKRAQNALIGLIPSSVGYTVLDVDDGSPLKLAWGLRPDYVCASGTPGRGHLWFSDDQPRPNSSWTLKSKAGEVFSGEVRSGSVASQATEDRLAQQRNQVVEDIATSAAVLEVVLSDFGKAQGIIKLSKSKKTSVGGDG